MAFHLNQQVVCIDDRFAPCVGAPYRGSMPVKGGVYTIAEIEFMPAGSMIGAYRNLDDTTYLTFTECGRGGAFASEYFRLVKTTSIEVFRQMLVTPRQPVDA